MNILLKNIIVLPMTGNINHPDIFTGFIGVCGNKITMASSSNQDADDFLEAHPNSKVIDGNGKLVMPGLINLHTHAAMTLLRGYANDMHLMTWLNEYVWPFEAKLKEADVAAGTYLAIAEMLLGGTTTMVDMYWFGNVVADVIRDTGIRGAVGNVSISGHNGFYDVHEYLVSHYLNGQCNRVIPMVAPHAPYTVTKKDLLECFALASEHRLSMQIHLSETAGEVEEMKRLHKGLSPVEYLDSLGILNEKCVAAHCVHVSEHDIEILAERKVSVAHNPQSNMILSSGIAPVWRMLRAGINVGLGTDGASSNNDLDMWEEMRTAALLSKVLSDNDNALKAYDVIYMATVAGAKALGMEDKLGQIKEGFLADMIIIDMQKPHLFPVHDIIANLAYCAKSSDVNTVIVNGEILVQEGKLTTIDYKKAMADVQNKAEYIISTLQKPN